jgi:eukaryotic-like serine/threonine-protein kinase
MEDQTRNNRPSPADEWTQMLVGDQRLRWQQGQRVSVEAYFEHYPELQSRSHALRELILGELRLRRELGDQCNLVELQARFPGEKVWLAEQFERLQPTPSSDNSTGDDSADSNWPLVSGYQVIEEVGHGGMGVVYKARDLRMNRLVAMKMLGAGANSRNRARLRHEADAIARLHHPYIVRLYDLIDHDNQLCLVMEFVGGGSLASRIRGQSRPPNEAAEYVRKLAEAMHYAHEHSIVHRDLKPSNVLLTDDGTPKISDFGLAKRLDDDTSLTQSGTVLGTPDYMAPEQAEGKVRDIGPPADIYGLGCILYELLTGQAPFRGEAFFTVLDAVRFKKPRPPSQMSPSVPRSLELICLKCLEKIPANRFANAADLADDLGRFMADRPVSAQPPHAWARLRNWVRQNL